MLRKILPVCLFLLMLAGCAAPPAPVAPTILPSSTPQPTTTFLPKPSPTVTPSGTSPAPTAAFTLTPTPARVPPMTREVAFAYHSPTGELVAFGGSNMDPGSPCYPCGEIWAWKNRQWSKRQPAHSPPARDLAALAYDAAHGAVVLFGGTTMQPKDFDDTWLWDGQDWTEIHASSAPSPRSAAVMAYDPVHQQVVLWGGQSWIAEITDYHFLSDTWTWDGKKWTEHHVPGPVNGPIPPASMAYDANLRQVVLWQYGEGLWTWDGSSWRKHRVQGPGPDPNTQAQIGFDEAHSRLVLRGSQIEDPSESEKTWTFDGSTWTQVEARTGPGTGYYQDAALVYDADIQALVYLSPTGGKSGPSSLLMETWTGFEWKDANAP